MPDTYTIPSTDVRVDELPKVGRRMRRPTHNFMVKHRPFAIQPFMIAPVLPGETMKNLLLQARVLTDAVKHPHLGWWNEMYFFYVKLRDLPERTDVENMLLTNAAPPAATAALTSDYYSGEGVNWVRKCLNRVAECYFRSEEENASGTSFDRIIDGMPMAKLTTMPGWMENLTADGDVPASDGTPLPGDYYPSIPDQYVGTPFEAAYAQWKEMQSLTLTPPSFEDYLKTFGIKPPAAIKEEKHIPELIRYVRNWSTPANVVGETGTVNSQVSWSVAERADKDRFFAEPGFIFGVTTTRPKMYSATQTGNMSSWLNDAYAWLPALLRPDPFTSLKKFAFGGSGPLANQTEDYWVDLADLFMGGDQFTNYTVTDPGFAGSPLETGEAIDVLCNYAPQADIDNLFVNAAGGKNLVRMEGRVDLGILSAVQDTTP